MPDIPNRTALESRFENLLKRSFGKHRARLLSSLGDPPDVANVPDSLWADIEQGIDDDTRRILALIFLLGSDGMSTQFNYRPDADEMGEIAGKYASGRSAFIAKSMVGTLRDRLDAATREGATGLSSRITDILGNQAAGAAITETTAANSAGEGGYRRIFQRDTKTKLKAIWRTAATGVCERCLAVKDQPEEAWKESFPDGTPAHGRCQCWLDWVIVETKDE